MVHSRSDAVDRIFAALADPTRRGIVARLSDRRPAAVSDLAAPFAMSLPAVLKHIAILADAGLVVREKTGRIVTCRLDPAPLREATAVLNHYQRFWSERLDALANFVEVPNCLAPTQAQQPRPPARASRSSGASPPRRPPSTSRGQTRGS
jgi:DNA-binding transcriptional ArsR family regulator